MKLTPWIDGSATAADSDFTAVSSSLTFAGTDGETQTFTIDVQGSYDPKEFVAQYKESNFAFVSRWMEREGMYFYFEQGADRDQRQHVDGGRRHEQAHREQEATERRHRAADVEPTGQAGAGEALVGLDRRDR